MMSTSIKQKITLFNLLPALVFYCFITSVFLYFAFRSASEEVGRRHLHQTLYYASLVNGSLSMLMQSGRAFSLAAENYTDNELVNKSLLLFSEIPIVSAIAIVKFHKMDGEYRQNVQDSYWRRQSDRDRKYRYDVPTTSYLSIKNPMDSNWYVNTDPASSPAFFSNFLIKVSDNSEEARFLRLEIDGNKLVDSVTNQDPRIRTIISDPEGNVVFANGVTLVKHRTFENLVKLGACEGHSELYTPSEFAPTLSQLLFSPIKAPADPKTPCQFMQDTLDMVVKAHKYVSIRVLNRSNHKWLIAVPIASTGWFFSHSILESELMKPVFNQAVLSVGLIGLAMLLSILCLWVVSGRITRPLNDLKNQMNVFGVSSEGEALVYCDSKDEAVSLGRSFVRLKRRLQDREIALQKARISNMGSLVQQLRGGYFYFNLTSCGDISYVSPSIVSVLGFPVNDFTGNIQQFLTDSVVNRPFISILQLPPQCCWQESLVLEMKHKDGSSRCIEVSCVGHLQNSYPIGKNDSRQVFCIEGMGNDITNRVRDTQKFKALIAGAPDAIVITSESGIITLINTRVESLFCYTKSDLIGMPLAMLIAPDYRGELSLLKTLDHTNAKGHCLHEKLSYGFDKHGHIFPVEISSNVLTTMDGELVSIVFRDITERVQIESELVKAKNVAEKASQAKSLFLSHISHELRTPLNGVLGYAQLLLADSGLPVRSRENLASLEACGLHLLTMINDILDITKIESGVLKSEPAPFNLRDTLEMVLANVREVARAKGLSLLLQVDGSVGMELMGDNVKLRQVLINLMGNAVKFCDSGNVLLNVTRVNQRLLFEVVDQGPGISTEDIQQLFKPFSQLKKGQELGGAGLGLSISCRLVKAMGGDLRVDSKLGAGSRFYFNIPYQLSNVEYAAGEVAKQEPIVTHREPHILVVDDNVNNRDMLVKVLKSKSYRVDSVSGGIEAVERCRTVYYDLILMDLHMPTLDGFAAARMILDQGRAQKIIAVSASVSEQVRRQVSEGGFCDFIAKPIHFDELFVALNRHDHPLIASELLSEMRQVLREYLDIGDLESLSAAARQWSQQADYGDLPDDIIRLCQLLDIKALEVLYERLADTPKGGQIS